MREGTAIPPELEFRPFGKWTPWIVPLFVFANVVMFIITMFVNDCPRNSFSCFASFLGRFSFQPLKENPLLGPSSLTLEKMGALAVSKVVGQREVWRLFTSIWLHAGVVHVLANMLSLVFIGVRLEKEFGFVKIGFLYVISGFGANILSTLFLESTISVGASGALFGLLGAMLSELLTNWTIYANKVAALLTLILIVIINLAVGILPHVDNFAHLGGFFSGFFLGFILLLRPQFGWVMQKHAPPGYVPRSSKPKHKTYQYVLWCASAVLLFAGMATGLVLIFRGVDGNKYCSWCHYLSCVPLTKQSCQTQEFVCESSQVGDEWNLTCVSSGRSHVYKLVDDNTSRVQQLCSQLCR